ncbi:MULTISPECIES: MFS transporter [unclassified Sporosarcina]|uniref:MFS transporter n=1 Tax=unclassified Sporosarcina TaxID=2647733 RepID=UPI002041AAD4|nr:MULTISPECIES: MFS transporter [unclassified Sporosarcina]GKV65883.1 putative MFS-type transporter YfkF [Sporosarcina sp. NCCP-2331]GLB56008.1 putative MFS-type transporter YfkF [Sporosarcina sp. NCCP-2378]
MNQRFAHFALLNATVAISGLSQGMLLPLIAIIFERDGVPSSINGIHAAGIYIGMLAATPFLEAPLRKIGFKPFILIGGMTVIVTLLLFTVWKSVWFWFILRLLIGIGNNILHFGTQTWITFLSSDRNRGRNLSLYGLCFGLGYGFGPLTTHFLSVSEQLPFFLAAVLSFFVWLSLFYLKNEFPESTPEAASPSLRHTWSQFRNVWRYAWIALLFPFAYGFLEASVSNNFPIYALRIGLNVSTVSTLLPLFAIGGIIFQLPLGMLSDKFGRRKILLLITPAAAAVFVFAGIFQDFVLAITICFFVAGMLVGSIFSLGLTYMVDLVPKYLLPAGNLMAGILFSFGSMTGPFIGGLTIQFSEHFSFFYTISIMLCFITLTLMYNKPKSI